MLQIMKCTLAICNQCQNLVYNIFGPWWLEAIWRKSIHWREQNLFYGSFYRNNFKTILVIDKDWTRKISPRRKLVGIEISFSIVEESPQFKFRCNMVIFLKYCRTGKISEAEQCWRHQWGHVATMVSPEFFQKSNFNFYSTSTVGTRGSGRETGASFGTPVALLRKIQVRFGFGFCGLSIWIIGLGFFFPITLATEAICWAFWGTFRGLKI